MLLIAVQKRPLKGQEPAVWVHELTTEQLPAGRKKCQKLLRCYAELASILPAPTSICVILA